MHAFPSLRGPFALLALALVPLRAVAARATCVRAKANDPVSEQPADLMTVNEVNSRNNLGRHG